MQKKERLTYSDVIRWEVVDWCFGLVAPLEQYLDIYAAALSFVKAEGENKQGSNSIGENSAAEQGDVWVAIIL